MSNLNVYTMKKYEGLLGHLEKEGINYKEITDYVKFKDLLENLTVRGGNKIKESSLKTYLSAIIWYYKKNNINNDKLMEMREDIIKISDNIKKEVNKNILIGNQKVNYEEWETLQYIYKELGRNYKKSYNRFRNFVILSNYILLAPRREKDYIIMHVSETNDNLDKELNYYIKQDGTFIFQNYKTSNKYGKQIIKLTEKHNNIIKDFVTTYNIKGSLFNLNRGSIGNKISKIFEASTNGKKIRINILRHSYISYITDKGYLSKKEDREKIAMIMAHSEGMQNEYYKDKEKEKENDIIVDNGILTMPEFNK